MKKLSNMLRPTNLLAIIAIIISPIIPMAFIRALDLKIAQPDTLAYFGSILGGILTLIGVSLTIKHSDNSYKKAYEKDLENEFIQSFPQKIQAINNVKTESKKLLSEFKSMGSTDKIDQEVMELTYDTLKELRNTYSNKLLTEAAKLDGHVYVEVLNCLEEIDNYNDFILDKARFIQSNDGEFKKKHAETCLKINRSIVYFDEYQKSIGHHFTNVTQDKNLWKTNPTLSHKQRKRKFHEKLFQRFSQSTKEKLTIIVAHNQTSPENPYQLGMEKFKEIVEEASSNAIHVEVHCGTKGTDEIELLNKLQRGSVHMAVVAPNVVSRTGINELDLLTLPYLFDDYDHWEKVVDGKVGQYISSLVNRESKKSLHVLGYLSAGVRHYYGKKPIVGLEDLKGMTVRTQTSGVAAEFLAKLGADTNALPWGEIFQGLQQEKIDFAENSYPYFVQQHHHKTDNGKYITETGHDYTTRLLLINGKAYAALTRQQKKIIIEAAKVAVEEERRAVFEQEYVYKEIAIQDGAEIYHIDPLPFKQIVEPMQKKFAKDIETESLLKSIKELKQSS